MRLVAAGVAVCHPRGRADVSSSALGKLSSMFFSVVSRSCWPESHFTGSVQKVPAPTLAGIRSDPSKRAAVAL